MRSIFSRSAWALIWALASAGSALAGGDDSAFELGAPLPARVQVLETTYRPGLGTVASRIAVTDLATGETEELVLAAPETSSGLHYTFAVRLKIPEIAGLRAGVRIDELVEIGADVGYGLFFNGVGAYLNYHPARGGFYVGGKYYRELVWLIFSVEPAHALEGVLGYRWGPSDGTGIFGFIELGATRVTFERDEKTEDRERTLPVLGLGLGYSF